MKWMFAFVFFSLIWFEGSAQTVRIKRKYCKTYSGEMPAYSAILGQEKIELGAAVIRIKLQRDSLFLTIGTLEIAGLYVAQSSANKHEIVLEMPRENSGINERLILNTAKKTLLRKGVFPQPDVQLTRVKSSPKR
ncbi:MAG: hypothetical protein ACO29Q_04395 [Crocinitomicaceae bacterium]